MKNISIPTIFIPTLVGIKMVGIEIGNQRRVPITSMVHSPNLILGLLIKRPGTKTVIDTQTLPWEAI